MKSVTFGLVVLYCSYAASQNPAFSEFEKQALAVCPCEEKALCFPVKTKHKHEVFAFSHADLSSSNWKYYNYSAVTTIAWNTNKTLLCHAHERNVKISILKKFRSLQKICNNETRKLWVEEAYREIVGNYSDGINIDVEEVIPQNETACFTLLIKELREELQRHEYTKTTQITVDVPWITGMDDRFYDFSGLAQYSDFLMVMAYDIRTLSYTHCQAAANSPIDLVRKGLRYYFHIYKIQPNKLVLGLPWYGYSYPCAEFCANSNVCIMGPPSSQLPCIKNEGSSKTYRDIVRMLKDSTRSSGRQWDNNTQTPSVNVKVDRTGMHQVHYDDPESLKIKYELARSLQLRGVGIWHVDSLDYSGGNNALPETQEMWDAVASYALH